MSAWLDFNHTIAMSGDLVTGSAQRLRGIDSISVQNAMSPPANFYQPENIPGKFWKENGNES
jgi:hypothetical protein